MSKIEKQKGPIDPNPMTSKQQNHIQRVDEATKDYHERKRAQTLDLHEPKHGRK